MIRCFGHESLDKTGFMELVDVASSLGIDRTQLIHVLGSEAASTVADSLAERTHSILIEIVVQLQTGLAVLPKTHVLIS